MADPSGNLMHKYKIIFYYPVVFKALGIMLLGALIQGSSGIIPPIGHVESTPIQITYENASILLTHPVIMNNPVQIVTPPPLVEIPEERLLVVEWPRKIRVGDIDTIRVTLKLKNKSILTPTTIISDQESIGEIVHYANLYQTHNVFAEARLDINGTEIAPAPEIVEVLRPGKQVNITWSIRPDHSGQLRGLIWFHLHFIPISGGVESRIPLTAQIVEIEAVNFLGLGGNMARLVGVLGTLLGSVLGLDNLFLWFWRPVKRLFTR
jgi:hypothetical protein